MNMEGFFICEVLVNKDFLICVSKNFFFLVELVELMYDVVLGKKVFFKIKLKRCLGYLLELILVEIRIRVDLVIFIIDMYIEVYNNMNWE